MTCLSDLLRRLRLSRLLGRGTIWLGARVDLDWRCNFAPPRNSTVAGLALLRAACVL